MGKAESLIYSQYYNTQSRLALYSVIYCVRCLLFEMQRTKSSTQTGCSSIRPISVTSNFKFEKFEKLNSLVNEIQENRKEEQGEERPPIQTLNPRQIKSGMSEKVLDLLKNRIKTNYDQLYGNYQDNKQKILKQIQAVETNIAGQNAMNSKFDEVIKQKSKFDKLKADVEEKQRKLRKLTDMRQQLKHQKGGLAEKAQEWSDVLEKINSLEEKKEEIQHQTLILNDMLRQRKQIHLNLRERHNRLFEDLTRKKQRSSKMSIQNLKKKNHLSKIQERIQKEEEVVIPPKLAQQLSNKIEMYENKHSYNNIIEHEAILEEERFRKIKQETQREREIYRNNKSKKDNDERTYLEQLYNLYLIKGLEEEKIKRLCGVDNIQEILSSNLNLDKENLDRMNRQIGQQIVQYEQQNKNLQRQLEEMVNYDTQIEKIDNIYDLEKIEEDEEKERHLLKSELEKKITVSHQWKTLLQFINPQQNKISLKQFTSQIEKTYLQKAANFDKLPSNNPKEAKFTKIPFINEEQSQQLD